MIQPIPKPTPQPQNGGMIAFLALAGVVFGLGLFFFRVIRPLIMPLFIAAVIAMLAYPLQERCTAWFRGRRQLAAALVTLVIFLLIIAPLASGAYLAVGELASVVGNLKGWLGNRTLGSMIDPAENPQLAKALEWARKFTPVDIDQVHQWALKVAQAGGEALYLRTIAFLGDLPEFLLSVFIFFISLYFFLVDGPKVHATWEELSPLDHEHDELMLSEFSKVCRAVVWATLAASVAQGILLGFGLFLSQLFFDVNVSGWIFLLSLLTMVFAMVPFVGAAAVWVPAVIAWTAQGHYGAAIFLGIYGLVLISTCDNLIKVLVIKGSANLHPLLVFVCVFGGLQLVGILGIFIGPIVGAVLFALMRILKQELLHLKSDEQANVHPEASSQVAADPAEPV